MMEVFMREIVSPQEFSDQVMSLFDKHIATINGQANIIAETIACLAIVCRAIHTIDDDVASHLEHAFREMAQKAGEASWVSTNLAKAASGDPVEPNPHEHVAQYLRLVTDDPRPE
jgi:hypothetical protein